MLDRTALAMLGAAASAAAGLYYFRRKRAPAPLRQAPGSRIGLAIGDRFASSDRFTGFVHEESGASLAAMEMPSAAFAPLQNLENAAATFEAQGVSGVAAGKLPQRSGEYVYLRGVQKTALVDYAKYILIFRENGLTGMVTANIPRAALTSGLISGREIEAIFTSARIGPGAMPAQALFTLGYLGPFEEDLSLLGTTKGYRLKSNGEDPGEPGVRPMFLVAPSLTIAPIPDLRLFAERTFDGIDHVGGKTAETVSERSVSGLPAVEIVGKGADSTSGRETLIYQLIVEARHGGYFRLLGLAPDRARASFLPEFHKIAESFSASS